MVELAMLQGCIHGEIDRCYEAAQQLEADIPNCRVKLVIWAGDVQTLRDEDDLSGLACPLKYRKLGEFPKYYNGEVKAPYLTIFAGGNHEASHFLQSLFFGGWVAPNIFYIGRTAVLNVGRQRIAGLSGIYKDHDYTKGFWETEPLNESTIRSCYHVRYYDIAKLSKIEREVNLMITHDWPTEVVQTKSDQQRLIEKKPFFEEELMSGGLGNPHTNALLRGMQPNLWAAAHFHVTYSCDYSHEAKLTKFIAHDKPKRVVSQSAWNLETGRCFFDCYPGWIKQCPEFAGLTLPIMAGEEGSSAVERLPSPENAQVSKSMETINTDMSAEREPEERSGESTRIYDIEKTDVENELPSQEAKRRRLSVDEIKEDSPVFNHSELEVDLEWLCILKRSIPQLPTNRRPDTEPSIMLVGPPTWRIAFEIARSVDLMLDANWEAQLRPYFVEMAKAAAATGVDEDAVLDHGIGMEVPLHQIRVAIPDWTTLKPSEPDAQTRWWITLVGEDPDLWNPKTVIADAHPQSHDAPPSRFSFRRGGRGSNEKPPVGPLAPSSNMVGSSPITAPVPAIIHPRPTPWRIPRPPPPPPK